MMKLRKSARWKILFPMEFVVSFVKKGHNLFRNMSKKLQRRDSAVDSIANKTKLKNEKVQLKGWKESPLNCIVWMHTE